MEIKSQKQDENLTVYLIGEIDHHNAGIARRELDLLLDGEQPATFGLDLSGVTFCDSSGLGLVMGRMKKCASVGSNMLIKNPSFAAKRILEIAGMDKILKIEGEK